MVPPDTAPKLVEVIWAMVPVVTGTSNLGAPSAIGFSMGDGPPASHKENLVHSWLQDTVEAHELLLKNIVCFAMSDFGGTHAGFRLMITCAVRRYGLMLRTPPLISADRALLLQIWPFALEFTESLAFLMTYKHSINLIVLSASFPSLRSLGGLMYRPSSSTPNLLTMLHSLRSSPI
jgi:hypothetical protein